MRCCNIKICHLNSGKLPYYESRESTAAVSRYRYSAATNAAPRSNRIYFRQIFSEFQAFCSLRFGQKRSLRCQPFPNISSFNCHFMVDLDRSGIALYSKSHKGYGVSSSAFCMRSLSLCSRNFYGWLGHFILFYFFF